METPNPATTSEWSSTKAYTLAVICLVVGVAVGALFHGPAQPNALPVAATPGAAVASQLPADPSKMSPQELAAIHQGAAAQKGPADPVFEKLKAEPNNLDLLAKAATASMKAGEVKPAIEYYGRSLKLKENPEVRLNLGNAYAYAGEADMALQEFEAVLKVEPKNDKALFNSGVVRLQGKNDPKGAIRAWETLLKYYPNHPHRAEVQEMINQARKPVHKAL
jgi:tetratricopeptide (TPR) repeat protein